MEIFQHDPDRFSVNVRVITCIIDINYTSMDILRTIRARYEFFKCIYIYESILRHRRSPSHIYLLWGRTNRRGNLKCLTFENPCRNRRGAWGFPNCPAPIDNLSDKRYQRRYQKDRWIDWKTICRFKIFTIYLVLDGQCRVLCGRRVIQNHRERRKNAQLTCS